MIKLKIASIILAVITGLNIIFFYYGKSTEPKTYEIDRIADGASMHPTIKDNEVITEVYGIEPKEGDIVGLICDNFKCTQELSDNILYKQEHLPLVKRLIKIDKNNCYWLEGDNKEESYDSRHFGWICPNDRHNVSIVKVH